MKLILTLFLLLFLNNCSLNKDSDFWTENTFNNMEEKKKLLQILKKSKDISLMTLEEYKIYIEDYTKKSNYPDINK
tara:strand:- start:206 stop:433 length:228 start_codon:yes stop_codon:yes gene_type:complete